MRPRPALLGGTPAFDQPLRIAEPTLPPLYDVCGALPALWARRGLTNHGPLEQELAGAIASRLGVAGIAMTGSATAGLTAVLMALGIRGEVIVPAYTFAATAHAVLRAGAKPRFADVDSGTWALTAESCAPHITADTEAIMAVHLFGQPADETKLTALAASHGLALVFDAAHAFGSTHPDGRPVGSGGRAEVFSFHATKLLAMGEGGAVTTDDVELARRCHLTVRFGDDGSGEAAIPGFNGKMQEWNALVGLRGLKHVDEWIARRQALASRYRQSLAGLPGLSYQSGLPGAKTNHQYLALRLDPSAFGFDGASLRQILLAEGIDARRYYAPSLHQHAAFIKPDAPPLPVSEELSRTIICLPLYAHLENGQVDTVCAAIHRAHSWRAELREVVGAPG